VGIEVIGADPVSGARVLQDLLPAARIVGWISAGLVLLLGLIALGRARRRSRRLTTQPTWACGYARTEPRIQYTASSFAAPLVSPYHSISGLRVQRGPFSFHSDATDPVLTAGILPLWHGLRWTAEQLRPIQQGRLALYLVYVVATVVILLLLLASPGGA
jgi:hypothetical protein